MMLFGLFVFLIVPATATFWVMSCVYREYRRDRVPVLLYHRLITKARAEQNLVDDHEMIWVTYDEAFEEQMLYLKKAGYHTLDLDEYVQIRAGRALLPPKPIILTFDDGYESNYSLAFPVLRKHELKATVFVVLEPDEPTRDLVEGIDGFLSASQLQEMSMNGISIQSHTLTHPLLTELTEDQILRELHESRRRLAAITGKAVNHLAIPRAGYNRRIRHLAAKVGYQTVCCNNKGSASGLSSRMAIPRIVVERDMTITEFASCLEPRMGVLLRIVGNIKRLPERFVGAGFAYKVRGFLYDSRLKNVFKLASLKWALVIGALVYSFAAATFWLWIWMSQQNP